ncbi:MAG: hypothetical protein QOD42_505 [Sphingomonadales bacterium]|nr:hypothetical protein [Sphingomonadales bacterium]
MEGTATRSRRADFSASLREIKRPSRASSVTGAYLSEKQKRPRGRPRTGVTPMTGVRIPADLDAKLTAWIERQPDPKPSRAEAIRRLIERGLGGE